jgi:pilus assembly protein CpaB
MKFTIASLVFLGFIAAICVVLLVNVLRVDTVKAKSNSNQLIMATQDLPAMSVLTFSAIELNAADGKEIPKDAYTNPAEVVGKILAVPVVQGQVLTKPCFVSDGNGAKLAAALPTGMRAVAVTLTNQSVSGGFIYPGCVVDVLASFKLTTGGLRSEESKGEAISTTLLHAVQVLGIQGESVISKSKLDEQKEKVSPQVASVNQKLTVTLLVDPRQAEALQLALDNGKISLAMRNPLDKQAVDYDATVLSRGRLSKLGSLLGSTVLQNKTENGSNETTGDQVEEGSRVQSDPLAAFAAWGNPKPSHWEVTVIRGDQVKEEELKLIK